MAYDNYLLNTSLYFKNEAGGFVPVVDTRCCGCGQLIDIREELAAFGDTGDIGASRHDRDSRNGYDLFHRRCPDTDIQNKQLATREEFFSKLLGQGRHSGPAKGDSSDRA